MQGKTLVQIFFFLIIILISYLFIKTYFLKKDEIKKKISKIEKININTCTIDVLKKHPYLDYYQANSLIKMRMQREKFSEIIEILDSKLINEEEFERISPYLSL